MAPAQKKQQNATGQKNRKNGQKGGSEAKKPSGDQKEKALYVGLLDSANVQRGLLEARKNALILLKRFEKVTVLREQRLYLEGELKSAIGELSSKMNAIVSDFPELPEETMEKAKSEPKQPSPTPQKPVGGRMSELDRKLATIDKRLQELE